MEEYKIIQQQGEVKGSVVKKSCRMIIRIGIFCSFLFILAVNNRAYSIETEILNCESDTRAFCRAVSESNKKRKDAKGLLGAKDGREMLVLSRTDGTEIDFCGLHPAQIIKGPGNRFVLVFNSSELAQEAVTALRSYNGILYAELDGEVHLAAEKMQFISEGAALMEFGEYLGFVRKRQRGRSLVAVIDSGVAYHSLLSGRVLSGGYDYVDGDEDSSNDLSGHGTHVAGIIADVTQGTATWIYPIRVLNSSGSGLISNVAAGVLEAIEAGVEIINLSLESYVMSEALEDSIRTAIQRGIIVVCAAGNSGEDAAQVCPARMMDAGMIVVGACEITSDGVFRASYSNYGKSVDVYACGTNITSCSRSGTFVTYSGTSQAAAYVSGACALVRLIWNTGKPDTIESRLKANAAGKPEFLSMIGLVPKTEGFALRELTVWVGEVMRLPSQCLPTTCFLPIEWSLSDESLATIHDDVLQAIQVGNTVLHAVCDGYEPCDIVLRVCEGPISVLQLDVENIEEEAFSGCGAENVLLTERVHNIGKNAFASCVDLQRIIIEGNPDMDEDLFTGSEQVVIVCALDSSAYHYALERELQYLLANERGGILQ